MIDSEYNCFNYQFFNCHEFYFESWNDNIKEDNTSKITSLELEINEIIQEDECIKIVCLCDDPVISGGNIYIKADDLIIHDDSNKQVTYEEITGISNDYWNRSG